MYFINLLCGFIHTLAVFMLNLRFLLEAVLVAQVLRMYSLFVIFFVTCENKMKDCDPLCFLEIFPKLFTPRLIIQKLT